MHGITSPELFPVFSARGGDWKLTDTFDIVIIVQLTLLADMADIVESINSSIL